MPQAEQPVFSQTLPQSGHLPRVSKVFQRWPQVQTQMALVLGRWPHSGQATPAILSASCGLSSESNCSRMKVCNREIRSTLFKLGGTDEIHVQLGPLTQCWLFEEESVRVAEKRRQRANAQRVENRLTDPSQRVHNDRLMARQSGTLHCTAQPFTP